MKPGDMCSCCSDYIWVSDEGVWTTKNGFMAPQHAIMVFLCEVVIRDRLFLMRVLVGNRVGYVAKEHSDLDVVTL